MSLATTTLEPLPQTASEQTEFPWMSSAVDSHAKTLAWPDPERVLMVPAADYGLNTLDLFASFDPATSSWRTSQHSLEGGLTESLETWPRSGLMRSGIAYRLPPLVPLHFVTDYGLRPTPTRTDFKGGCLEPRSAGDRRHWWGAKYGNPYPSIAATEAEMGFPPMWTELQPSETPSSRKSRKLSGGQ